eukprot:172133-Alexandrium_andersonii.AAC.1
MASSVQSLNCAGPGMALTSLPKLPRGVFCAVVRADAEFADDGGRGVHRRRVAKLLEQQTPKFR